VIYFEQSLAARCLFVTSVIQPINDDMRFLTRHHHWIALLIAVCMVFAHVGDAEAAKKKKRSVKRKPQVVRTVAGVNDPRYAAIIMNPATGEIYHQKNADERRYPASLTKMMTLYLLFEALEKKKIDLDDDMRVSAYAASMPQTNLSLDEDERIDVETAIKSLVVRSANDVSVVIAEKLGGDVETFARMMTNKARALGMKNTIFKNPNGLPNSGQVTTARDMAKLGIALKRDFPKYYPYFSTLQFSHNGVTYYTHNRVLLRYAGADGIKTGYIGASGFNLVTSVERGGRPIVGAVMGGSSGRWRDARMIELLDESYRLVASRGAARGKPAPANLPLPKNGGKQGSGITDHFDPNADPALVSEKTLDTGSIPEADETLGAEPMETLPDAEIPASREAIRNESPFEAAERAAVETRVTQDYLEPIRPPEPKSNATAVGASKATAAKAPVRSVELAPTSAAPQPAPPPASQPAIVLSPRPHTELANPPVAMGDRTWGIQVGAFSTQDLADQALRNALQTAPKPLASARISMMGPSHTGVPVHRARLENLSQSEAKLACETLIAHNSPCFIFNAAPQ
jgi:D-alanyl-D-alanine carboxypeptidase